MLELDMDIKCNYNHYYFSSYKVPPKEENTSFRGLMSRSVRTAEKCADVFVERPIATECAIGLSGIRSTEKGKKSKSFIDGVKSYFINYKKNIQHTYEHKLIFALVEKEVFGSISMDSVTHDLDKLIMYILGLPKPIVSKIHRSISEHHPQSGKKPNFRSMICDNIASSPEFKPEKTLSLREHYKTCQELQKVRGFGEYLEMYNFGEDLDFEMIKTKKKMKYGNVAGLGYMAMHVLELI